MKASSRGSSAMWRVLLALLAPMGSPSVHADAGVRLDSAGIHIQSAAGESRAALELESIGKFQVRLTVAPGDARGDIELQGEVSATGPMTWPAENLFVIDEAGQAMPIRRDGLEWNKFSMTVPAIQAAYVIGAVPPSNAQGSIKLPTEGERVASESATGVRAVVCRWYGGRDAALSIRFDDSDPTHLKTALPLLREYGFRATFMLNPGKRDFLEHRAEWKACARRADQEFGNHTMNHRGARSDEEADTEIGPASQEIWRLFPERSKLVALNLGGGTFWTTCKPFSHYLDKYHLFNVSGSLGMDDVYGNRVEAIDRLVVNTVGRGGWARVHFHAIGPGLSSSEQNFRAAMELIKNRAGQLWITGLADAFKYQEERKATKIGLSHVASDQVELTVACGTDAALYDQPLSVQFELPPDWAAATLSVASNSDAPTPTAESKTQRPPNLVRFHVAPVNGRYQLRRAP